MATAATIEERLTALELQVAQLLKQQSTTQKKPSWFEKIAGSFKDDPEFDEVLRLGREIRNADRPAE